MLLGRLPLTKELPLSMAEVLLQFTVSKWWTSSRTLALTCDMYFQQSYVAIMFNLGAAASYTEVTEDMRALANAALSVVGQTKVVEDAFNRCRKNEQHGGNGALSIRDLRKYMKPVSAKVLEEVHHFRDS